MNKRRLTMSAADVDDQNFLVRQLAEVSFDLALDFEDVREFGVSFER